MASSVTLCQSMTCCTCCCRCSPLVSSNHPLLRNCHARRCKIYVEKHLTTDMQERAIVALFRLSRNPKMLSKLQLVMPYFSYIVAHLTLRACKGPPQGHTQEDRYRRTKSSSRYDASNREDCRTRPKPPNLKHHRARASVPERLVLPRADDVATTRLRRHARSPQGHHPFPAALASFQ